MKIAVAMSGGVDSSVAAALLKEKGHEVAGVTMEVWDGGYPIGKRSRHSCYGPGEKADIRDARRVAQVLGIAFHTFDLRQEYKAEVLDYFRREYLLGRTPNPCTRCNRRVKFDALLKKARDSGLEFDYFASGHYARVEYDEIVHRYLLKKARDTAKDQSYFLFSLSQEQLAHCLFPLGNYAKEEVRKIARARGLGVEGKPESQNFLAGDYSSFLGRGAGPGPILDSRGNILGQHRGIPFYTIGQRKGLGIPFKEPLYVKAIDVQRNAIVAGTRREIYGDELVASELNWISLERLQDPMEVKAKIRYQHREARAVIAPLDDDRVYLKFEVPQMAITPGQAVVFYGDHTVVGGGTIERAGR